MQENSRKNKDVGDEGERVACEHLIDEGFEIVARNVRYKCGEIDIVARKRGELHFIEVKTRNNPEFVNPIEVVTGQKQRKIRMAAQMYLNDARNGFKQSALPACYFGVIGIDFVCGKPRIECIFDAFV